MARIFPTPIEGIDIVPTKADEVSTLLETAADCGIEKDADLFWCIFEGVYGAKNEAAAFAEVFGETTRAVMATKEHKEAEADKAPVRGERADYISESLARNSLPPLIGDVNNWTRSMIIEYAKDKGIPFDPKLNTENLRKLITDPDN